MNRAQRRALERQGGNMASKKGGNGHPRKQPGEMKQMQLVPEAEPTPLPDRVERINTVRVRVIGDRIAVQQHRACGHEQNFTLGRGSDLTITFGAVLLPPEDGQMRMIEDCVECELINEQRAMALQALAQESIEKGQEQTQEQPEEQPEESKPEQPEESEEPPPGENLPR